LLSPSAPTPITWASAAGKVAFPGAAVLPVDATTSVPVSCSACRLSISAALGGRVADTFTTSTSRMLRNHANAAIRLRESVAGSHVVGSAMRAIASPTFGATPLTLRSGRLAPIRLATSVPCPLPSLTPLRCVKFFVLRRSRVPPRRLRSAPVSATPTVKPDALCVVRWIVERQADDAGPTVDWRSNVSQPAASPPGAGSGTVA
jgi:hypothetical protein